MFGIGLYEALVVLVVICIVSKPEEIPDYLKQVKKFYHYFMRLKSEIYYAINDDNYIEGDDGKMYKSYVIEHKDKGDK